MASRGTFSVYEDDDPLLSPLSGSESVQASGAVDGRVTTTAAVPVGRSCSAGFSRWGVLAFSLVSYSGLGFGDTFGLYSQAVKNNFNCTQVCARVVCVVLVRALGAVHSAGPALVVPVPFSCSVWCYNGDFPLLPTVYTACNPQDQLEGIAMAGCVQQLCTARRENAERNTA